MRAPKDGTPRHPKLKSGPQANAGLSPEEIAAKRAARTSTGPRRRTGPMLSQDWRERFLAYFREMGGLYRAAEAADVSYDTVSRERRRDPTFDQAVLDAREYYSDVVEERMMALGERSNNPVPSIVRLKALRPREYIERQAILTVNVTAETTGQEALEIVRGMLQDMSEPTRRLLEAREAEAQQRQLASESVMHDARSPQLTEGASA